MTHEEFRSAVLAIVQADIQPLIESVLQTVQGVQASEQLTAQRRRGEG
jgi:hypothetical protein